MLRAWRITTNILAWVSRSFTLRATQAYRRESGEWRVAHRHGDTVTG
jgi:ketosteroid isomerase-like protein